MYKRYRFPPEIIQYAVWLYFRFNLRRVETVIGILRIYWSNVELLSHTNQLNCGATSSDRNMRPGCVENTEDTATPFSLMRYSSRLMASNVIFGVQWIKMVKSLMCFSKRGAMRRLQSDSSNECWRNTKVNHVKLWQISWEVMAWHTGNLSRTRFMIRRNMRTTELNYLTNQPGWGSVVCVGSNLLNKPSDF